MSTVSISSSKTMQTGSDLDGSEDELIRRFAEDIAREMDFLTIRELVCRDWFEIILTPMGHEKSEAIDQWLKDECQGRCHHMGLVFLFEQQGDAAMFALRFV